MRIPIDLRSDTVTRPTAAMRAVMAEAIVGDDVLDDDPTVDALQEKAAALLGKEAGLFLPTGTMSNLVAITVQTSPGDEVLMDSRAHSMLYEAGNAAAVAHVLTRQFSSADGVPDVDEVAALMQKETLHSPRTALLVLENTHNRAGGIPLPLATMARLHCAAAERGVAVHLDGARLFNAATALGVPVSALADQAETVTFCLSKGLGCPVGSVLCGSSSLISRARRVRKMLGGGMRQVGILAAAGIYALDHHVERLGQDHAHARMLAAAVRGAGGLSREVGEPATNMVFWRSERPAAAIADALKSRFGVLVSTMGSHTVRAVCHLDVNSEDIAAAARAFHAVCEGG